MTEDLFEAQTSIPHRISQSQPQPSYFAKDLVASGSQEITRDGVQCREYQLWDGWPTRLRGFDGWV